MAESEVTILGLSRIEAVELLDQLSGNGRLQESGRSDDVHGTADLVALCVQHTPEIATIICVWLVQKRANETIQFEHEEHDAKGAMKKTRVIVDRSSSEGVGKDVVDAVATAFGMPKSILESLIEMKKSTPSNK